MIYFYRCFLMFQNLRNGMLLYPRLNRQPGKKSTIFDLIYDDDDDIDESIWSYNNTHTYDSLLAKRECNMAVAMCSM